MLSAFKAQPIHELKPRDKSKIESLLAYGDRLLAGLNNGALRIYRVNESNEPSESNGDVPPSPTKSKAVDLLWEEEKFSKKPVQQLAMIKEANLLVSLSDTYVSLHDLQTYQLVERLERTKGASCFTVTSNVVKDPETEVPGLVSRLAVGTKRKILCWTWQDLELLEDVTEINLEASVKSLVWANGTRLVTGMDPGFSVVDILSQEIMPINKNVVKTASTADVNTGELVGVRFGAVSSSGMGYMGMGSWVPKPMATPMSGDEVLLAKDVNTLFIDTDGNALEKRQVPWALAPEAIGYSYPYLLALNPPEKGTLQIRNPDTLSLLQTINVPGAIILHVPQPNISLAHAGKGFLVASDRTIWRMNALSYDSQLADLVERQRFDEALSLLTLLEDTLIEDKAGRVREVMIQKATALFHQQKYRPALDLFTDAEASPDRVISLYPRIIARELSMVEERSEDRPGSTENGSAHEDAGKPEPVTPQKGMLGKLRGSTRKADSDAASLQSPARADTDNMSIRNKAATKTSDRPLEGDDLKFAVRCLSSYLAQTRRFVQLHLTTDGIMKEKPPVFDPETGKPTFHNLLPQALTGKQAQEVDWEAELLKIAQLVDTTLFRSYMLSQPTLIGSLFRLPNFCEPEVVQSALYEGERYNELIDFLHGKKLHRQALAMLAKFGRGNADGDVPQSMRGPDRTVAYLKQLPPELVDLILEFVHWPLEEQPEVGLEVFLADSDNAEKLPRGRILEFLASINETLEIQYLEHIINELGDSTDEFHQQLVDLYLLRLKQPDVNEDERVALKSKLESFLTESNAYSLNKTLRQLPTDDPTFYESRASVLSAMEQHKQALSIYVFQIQDYSKAEAYCNKTYLKQQAYEEACLVNNHAAHHHEKQRPFKAVHAEDTSEKPNIFATLLGLYLNPPPGEEKRWPQALGLLSKHGARLPASSTLNLMPDDLAIQELQDYFRGRIRNATSILREEMIVRSLEGVKRANTERLLLLGPDNLADEKPMGKNRRVRIGPEDHCKVCHKRFGASAVRVYPDNTVVHYGCIGKGGGGVGGTQRQGAQESGLGLGRLRRQVDGWA